MGGDEINGGRRPATLACQHVRGTGHPRRELLDLAGLALPVTPRRVAELAVPLRPAGREAADLVAAFPQVPGLGDQLDPGQDGVLAHGVEESRAVVESVGI